MKYYSKKLKVQAPGFSTNFVEHSLSKTRCVETLPGESIFIAATYSFYDVSADSSQLLATIKLLLCCAVNSFRHVRGRPDGARRR